MKLAFQEALAAYEADEVPIGAVVVSHGRVIGRAHNLTERLNDVTAHAEMQSITSAASFLGGKYLDECTMYVTMEPCVMCAGALAHAHLGRLVFGAFDQKNGYSRYEGVLHPKTKVMAGVWQADCSDLIRKFFREKRKV